MTKQFFKYYYQGVPFIEYCRQNGIDYRFCCGIMNKYRRRFDKEMPVEEAVEKAKNRTPSFKQQLIDLGVPEEKRRIVYARITQYGWSVEKAINTPILKRGRPRKQV